MISNSGHDENNNYNSGKAGDQTGTEWEIRSWYSRPWDCVLRHPDATVRAKLAELSKKAAENNNIGYDQYERNTYWYQLAAVNYDPSKITVPCESDCSAGVCSNVKAVGYILNISALKNVRITSTHYMKDHLRQAGFQVLTDSKYLTSDKYLVEGDILLNIQNHTAVNLGNGSFATQTVSTTSTASKATAKEPMSIAARSIADKQSDAYKGTYVVDVDDYLCLRASSDTSVDSNVLAKMQPGEKVMCYGGYYRVDDGYTWLYVGYGMKVGFVAREYLTKV